MTFVEACELLTEILVGKKKPVSRKKKAVKSVTNSKTRRRYQRRKQK
jgi:hypothetical protein